MDVWRYIAQVGTQGGLRGELALKGTHWEKVAIRGKRGVHYGRRKKKDSAEEGTVPAWSGEKANMEYVLRNAPPEVKMIFDRLTEKGKKELLAGRTEMWREGDMKERKEGLTREEMIEFFPTGGGRKEWGMERTNQPLIKYLISHNRIKDKEVFRGVVLNGKVEEWEAYLGGLQKKTLESKEEEGIVLGGKVGTKGNNTMMDTINDKKVLGMYTTGDDYEAERIPTRLRIRNKKGLLASPGYQLTYESEDSYHWLVGGKTRYKVKAVRRVTAKDVVGKHWWERFERALPVRLEGLKEGLEIELEQIDR